MPLLDLTLEAAIPDDVMWPLMDGKHIVSVPHHRELLVDGVDDGLDKEIDGIPADFAMRLKEVTLTALDSTAREVKRLSESVPKVNDRKTCFEYVMLSVRLGVSGVFCHMDSSNDATGHDDGWWFWSFCHLDSLTVTLDLNVGRPVLICLHGVK